MKIAILDYANYPFIRSVAENLIQNGFDLHFYHNYAFPSPNQAQTDSRFADRFHAVRIDDSIQKKRLVTRLRQELRWGKKLCDDLERLEPDLIISANMPLSVQSALQKRCERTKSSFVFWLQDIHGVAIQKYLQKTLGFAGFLLGKGFIKLESRLLRKSHHVITISDTHTEYLRLLGISEDRISCIPNWAPVNEYPLFPKVNDWSSARDLARTFNFMYAGTLGIKHDSGLFIDLAQEFRRDPAVRIVVVSNGPGADELKASVRRNGLSNLIVFSFQDHAVVPEMLASADVLLTILEEDASLYSVPSKVLTYLCAGRPQLLSVPVSNPVSTMISRINAGKVVRPEDRADFVDAARWLFEHPTEAVAMGHLGRRYAEENFHRGRYTEALESVFKAAIDR